MPLVCLTLGSVLPLPAGALGIRLADQDAEATARGNAFAATADNPAAVYYNPAGITQLAGVRTRVGVYAITVGTDYRSPLGGRSHNREEFEAIPQFYLTWTPDQRPVSVGLGIYSPYGLSLEWPEDSGFRTVALRGRISYLCVNPVIAWKVLPALSVAAGPTLNYSEAELQRGILAPGDQFKFRGDGTDFGFNAGLRWQPHEQHAFGLTYRAATQLDYRGRAELRSVVPFLPSASGKAAAAFDFPQHVVVGWSYRPSPQWNLEFNADWTDWDRLNTVTLTQDSGPAVPLAFNWRSSWFYEFGVTRQFGHGLAVSAGYIFSENSVPDRDFTPLVPDSDRHIFSLGVGQQTGHWQWAAAYQFAYGPPRTVSGSLSPSLIGQSADGRYQTLSHGLTLSLGYSF